MKVSVTRGCIPLIVQDGILVEFEEQLVREEKGREGALYVMRRALGWGVLCFRIKDSGFKFYGLSTLSAPNLKGNPVKDVVGSTLCPRCV